MGRSCEAPRLDLRHTRTLSSQLSLVRRWLGSLTARADRRERAELPRAYGHLVPRVIRRQAGWSEYANWYRPYSMDSVLNYQTRSVDLVQGDCYRFDKGYLLYQPMVASSALASSLYSTVKCASPLMESSLLRATPLKAIDVEKGGRTR